MKKEIWKDILGYEGLYMVSNYGSVYSVPRTSIQKTKHGCVVEHKYGGRYLKGKIDNSGYRSVLLLKDGIKTWFFVHRLVAEAFLENPYNKPYVDHMNTIRDDNRVDNLRYVDSLENAKNYVSVQHKSRPSRSTSMRGLQKSKRKSNKINGIDLRVSNNKAYLSDCSKEGALLSICLSTDERVCDFWVSWESLQNLRDSISDYLESSKVKSI